MPETPSTTSVDDTLEDMPRDAPTKGAYRPRRRRSGDPPPFQITPRDLDILRFVARRRFVHSDHVRSAIPGSEKNLSNRLKGLFEHGLLDRPECQYDFYRPGGGSGLAVYALAQKGAELLADQDGFRTGPRVSWLAKNKSAGRPFLEHTLAITNFVVALKADAARHGGIDLTDDEALIARLPEATRRRRQPLRLTTAVVHRGTRLTLSVEPDYAVSLGFIALGRRANFLVEIDRGTMPVARSDLQQTSVLRKLLTYDALWRAKAHTTELGWRNFRVLFVTATSERSENIRRTLGATLGPQGSPLFWFLDSERPIDEALLSRTWIDGAGQPMSLLPAR